jgi:MFS family permease
VNRQIILIIFISLMGISTALLPFSQNLSHFYSCVFGYGLGSGVWFSAYNVWVIEIWQQNSAPILQLSQFMYGIGTIFGPLIDRPYLTGELIHSLNNGAINTMGNTTEDQSLEAMLAEDNVIRRDKLHTPFLIIGALECIGNIILTVHLI